MSKHSKIPTRKKPRLPRRPDKLQLLFEPLEDRCLLDAGLFYSIDGTGNNLANPEWGSTDEQLLRVSDADYGDGLSEPAGEDRPSAREISNVVAAHVDEDTPNDRNLSAFLYVWGQFLDHDIDLTIGADPAEPFNIEVPTGDPYFDPNNTGTQEIPLNRSIYDTETGVTDPREQLTLITSWIDGSMIYGSDEETANRLREFVGGRMLVSEGDLPPISASGFYDVGDIRGNENVQLTAMHTLFLREHNYWADRISSQNPDLTDEEIYQRARSMVIAEIQSITYNEFLPALLGRNGISRYEGYDPTVDPSIANEFSTAAYRLHTTINEDVEFFDNNGQPITFEYVNAAGETVTVDGSVPLSEAFFNPALFAGAPFGSILKYVASAQAEEIDTQLVDSLRNFLFGPPGAGGLDLASLNIQRGRDHGLADYNSVREAYGLPRVTNFAEITSDEEMQASLESLYGSVDNIDLWVGLMAEDHVRGSSMGETAQAIIADQFERLRDGDRLWYQNIYSGRQLDRLENTTLAQIIERNTDVEGLQRNVFFFEADVQGRVFFDGNGDGRQQDREPGLPGVTVELLGEDGEVLASVLTDPMGRYSFDDFTETGTFEVRVVVPETVTATDGEVISFQISTGDETERGVNFGLRLAESTGDPRQDLDGLLTELDIEDLDRRDRPRPPRRRR